MARFYLVPTWFLGYDIVMETVIAIITILIAVYALRIYRLTQQQSSQLFALGFASIAGSYMVKAFFNMVWVAKIGPIAPTELGRFIVFSTFTFILHMVFFIFGLVILLAMGMRAKSWRIPSLILLISIASILLYSNSYHLFHIVSGILLLYLVLYYIDHYKSNPHTLPIIIAFIFILIGTVDFAFAFHYEVSYVLGHILEMIGYMILLFNLIKVVSK